jgi:hypothetical protein
MIDIMRALAWLGAVLLAGIAVFCLAAAWRFWRAERDKRSRDQIRD